MLFRNSIVFSLAMTFLFSLLCISLHAKDTKLKKLNKKADFYFIEQNYVQALPIYEKLDSIVPNNLEYLYKLGVCYLFTSDSKSKALKVLEDIKATEISTVEEDFLFFLAKAYHENYKFDDAVIAYEKYLSDMGKILSKEKIIEVRRQIEMCENGKQLIKDSVDVHIENIGKPINSEYPEYAVVISADEELLFFTSKRPSSTGGLRNIHGNKDPKGEYFEDIFMSQKGPDGWKEPINIGEIINTKGHDASIGVSADARQLFIYRSDKKLFGDIYVSNFIDDKWFEPELLAKPINTKKYWEGSASLSADSKNLYFVSNRPGGYGGKDIYKSVLLSDGAWSEPENLGPQINTQYDEDAPFIHSDKQTLYFSSKGHNSMGGYDIFKSLLKNDTWSKAKNLGNAFNTPDNDIYFVLSGNGKSGYFSSARHGGYGSQDIYKVFMSAEIEKLPVLANISGTIDVSGEFIPAKVLLIKDSDNKIVNFDNVDATTGNYALEVYEEGNYKIIIQYQGFLYESEPIQITSVDTSAITTINQDFDLASEKIKDKLILLYLFFTQGNADLTTTSKKELDKIYTFHINNPNLIIEIIPETDTIIKDYNNEIITARVKNTINYLSGKNIDTTVLIVKNQNIPQDSLFNSIEIKLLESSLEEVLVTKIPLDKIIPKEPDTTVFAFSTVHFDFDKSFIKVNDRRIIDNIYNYLINNTSVNLEVGGHTDAVGTANYNQILSEKRAKATVTYFINKGIHKQRLIVKGYGETFPIATNKTVQGRQQNRRVEFKIK